MMTVTTFNPGMIAGLFRDHESAERAYQSVCDRGYETHAINLVMTDQTRRAHFSGAAAAVGPGSNTVAGADVGSATGGIAAALAAVEASIAIPGVGVVAVGPIAAAFAGVGSGAASGVLAGVLVGSGIPEEQVEVYQTGIERGGILMGVRPRSVDDAEQLENAWKACRAQMALP